MEDGAGEDGVDRLVQLQLVRSETSTSSPGRSTSRTFSTIEGEPSTATTRPRGSRSISSPVTRPLPQPASSTVSSPPAAGGRAPSAPTLRGDRRRGGSSRRPSRGSPTRHQSAVVTGPRSAPPACSKLSIAPAFSSVMPMSSRPFSRRCLTSGSTSNLKTPAAQVTVSSSTSIAGLAGLGDGAAVLLVEDRRQQPDLGAVGVEDVGEGRRDDRLEAEVLQRPGGVLARGAAAEVAARRPGSGSAPARSRRRGSSRRRGTRRSRSARPA